MNKYGDSGHSASTSLLCLSHRGLQSLNKRINGFDLKPFTQSFLRKPSFISNMLSSILLKMRSNELRKLAEQKIQEGKSHQETFEELKEETKVNPVKIAKIVRYIPTLKNREKYKSAQTLLIVFLGITILFKSYEGFLFMVEKAIIGKPHYY